RDSRGDRPAGRAGARGASREGEQGRVIVHGRQALGNWCLAPIFRKSVPDTIFRRGTVALSGLLGGCGGVQSTFATFGTEAETVRALAVVMFSAAALITAAVLALAAIAVRRDEGIGYRGGLRVVLWLGGIGPTLLLTALLLAALPQMRPLAAPAGGLSIAVDGEQFWWRVAYRPDGGAAVETANEIRMPVGRPVTFVLESPDVIHSFWIP